MNPAKLIVKCRVCNSPFVKDINIKFHQKNICGAKCFIAPPLTTRICSEAEAKAREQAHEDFMWKPGSKYWKEKERVSRKKQRRARRHRQRPNGVHFGPFYESEEWKEMRYRVFSQYGRICMCCGTKAGTIHVDHIKPRSRFPQLELDFNNLQVLCINCKKGKSNTSCKDFRPTE